MRIEFEVGGKKVEFHRDSFWGGVKLVVDGNAQELVSSSSLSTHFNYEPIKTWTLNLFGHRVDITKTRPLFLAGFRPHHYMVLVDGVIVADRTGY